MRKSILISVIVAVLALGGIGAAFATNMDINGVGALSSGTAAVTEIDCIDVNWSLGGNAHDPCLDCLFLQFDQDLRFWPETPAAWEVGSTCRGELWIDFQDDSSNSIGSFQFAPSDTRVVSAYAPPTEWLKVDLSSGPGPSIDPEDVYKIKITYAD